METPHNSLYEITRYHRPFSSRMSDITLEQSPDTAEAKPYDEDKPPATYEDVTEEKYEEIPPVAEKPKKDDVNMASIYCPWQSNWVIPRYS